MFKRILSLTVIICFFLTTLGPLPKAHADTVLNLPAPGTMVNLSPAYQPVIIKGLTVHKDNPFLFDFIVDVGQDKMSGEPLKKEGEKLIKYFLASLAIPDRDLWVNLSPYEKNRIIPETLGQTDMGRDLLEQDYILKQITASLIYPEKQLGKIFWDKVYAKAQEMYGTTQVPVNTFNKVWIMADKAEVFEHNQTAFVVDCHLKVMLEEDYLALQKHNSSVIPAKAGIHSLGSQIVRTIILPELEKEVNTGKNFANLRQIFNSLILASWYKKNLKTALLNQVYSDKEKVKGINLKDPNIKAQIYQRYLQAYKKGVFNFIKEDSNQGTTVPRKYFSGGIDPAMAIHPEVTHDSAMLSRLQGLGLLVVMAAGFLINFNQPKVRTVNELEHADNIPGIQLIRREEQSGIINHVPYGAYYDVLIHNGDLTLQDIKEGSNVKDLIIGNMLSNELIPDKEPIGERAVRVYLPVTKTFAYYQRKDDLERYLKKMSKHSDAAMWARLDSIDKEDRERILGKLRSAIYDKKRLNGGTTVDVEIYGDGISYVKVIPMLQDFVKRMNQQNNDGQWELGDIFSRNSLGVYELKKKSAVLEDDRTQMLGVITSMETAMTSADKVAVAHDAAMISDAVKGEFNAAVQKQESLVATPEIRVLGQYIENGHGFAFITLEKDMSPLGIARAFGVENNFYAYYKDSDTQEIRLHNAPAAMMQKGENIVLAFPKVADLMVFLLTPKAQDFVKSFNGLEGKADLIQSRAFLWVNGMGLTWQDLKAVLDTRDSQHSIARQGAVILLRSPERQAFIRSHSEEAWEILVQHALFNGIEGNYFVRVDSYLTLAVIDIKKATPILIQGMSVQSEPIIRVRREIVRYIRRNIKKFRGNQELRAALVEASYDPDSVIREAASSAIEMFDSAQVSFDAAMLTDDERGTLARLGPSWTASSIQEKIVEISKQITVIERQLSGEGMSSRVTRHVFANGNTMGENLRLMQRDLRMLETADRVLTEIDRLQKKKKLERDDIWKKVKKVFSIKQGLTTGDETAINEYRSGSRSLSGLLELLEAKLALPAYFVNDTEKIKALASYIELISGYGDSLEGFLSVLSKYLNSDQSDEENTLFLVIEIADLLERENVKQEVEVATYLANHVLGLEAGNVIPIPTDAAMTTKIDPKERLAAVEKLLAALDQGGAFAGTIKISPAQVRPEVAAAVLNDFVSITNRQAADDIWGQVPANIENGSYPITKKREAVTDNDKTLLRNWLLSQSHIVAHPIDDFMAADINPARYPEALDRLKDIVENDPLFIRSGKTIIYMSDGEEGREDREIGRAMSGLMGDIVNNLNNGANGWPWKLETINKGNASLHIISNKGKFDEEDRQAFLGQIEKLDHAMRTSEADGAMAAAEQGRKVKGIVYDLNGTLLTDGLGKAIDTMHRVFGIKKGELRVWLSLGKEADKVRLGTMTADHYWDYVLSQVESSIPDKTVLTDPEAARFFGLIEIEKKNQLRNWLYGSYEEIPGVSQMIGKVLGSGRKIGIFSSMERARAEYLQEKFPWLRPIVIKIPADVGSTKPSDESFEGALGQFATAWNLKPEDILYADDDPINLIHPARLGYQVLLANPRGGSPLSEEISQLVDRDTAMTVEQLMKDGKIVAWRFEALKTIGMSTIPLENFLSNPTEDTWQEFFKSVPRPKFFEEDSLLRPVDKGVFIREVTEAVGFEPKNPNWDHDMAQVANAQKADAAMTSIEAQAMRKIAGYGQSKGRFPQRQLAINKVEWKWLNADTHPLDKNDPRIIRAINLYDVIPTEIGASLEGVLEQLAKKIADEFRLNVGKQKRLGGGYGWYAARSQNTVKETLADDGGHIGTWLYEELKNHIDAEIVKVPGGMIITSDGVIFKGQGKKPYAKDAVAGAINTILKSGLKIGIKDNPLGNAIFVYNDNFMGDFQDIDKDLLRRVTAVIVKKFDLFTMPTPQGRLRWKAISYLPENKNTNAFLNELSNEVRRFLETQLKAIQSQGDKAALANPSDAAMLGSWRELTATLVKKLKRPVKDDGPTFKFPRNPDIYTNILSKKNIIRVLELLEAVKDEKSSGRLPEKIPFAQTIIRNLGAVTPKGITLKPTSTIHEKVGWLFEGDPKKFNKWRQKMIQVVQKEQRLPRDTAMVVTSPGRKMIVTSDGVIFEGQGKKLYAQDAVAGAIKAILQSGLKVNKVETGGNAIFVYSNDPRVEIFKGIDKNLLKALTKFIVMEGVGLQSMFTWQDKRLWNTILYEEPKNNTEAALNQLSGKVRGFLETQLEALQPQGDKAALANLSDAAMTAGHSEDWSEDMPIEQMSFSPYVLGKLTKPIYSSLIMGSSTFHHLADFMKPEAFDRLMYGMGIGPKILGEIIKTLRSHGYQLGGDPISLNEDVKKVTLAYISKHFIAMDKSISIEPRPLKTMQDLGINTVGEWNTQANSSQSDDLKKISQAAFKTMQWFVDTYLPDQAMTAYGGIDLNASNINWNIRKDGNGVEMNIDPAMIERIKREGIDSLSPVIFKITPVTSIWPLVGLQAPVQAERLAGV